MRLPIAVMIPGAVCHQDKRVLLSSFGICQLATNNGLEVLLLEDLAL